MDERKLAIILGVTGLLLIFLVLFFIPSKKTRKDSPVGESGRHTRKSQNTAVKNVDSAGIENKHFSGGSPTGVATKPAGSGEISEVPARKASPSFEIQSHPQNGKPDTAVAVVNSQANGGDTFSSDTSSGQTPAYSGEGSSAGSPRPTQVSISRSGSSGSDAGVSAGGSSASSGAAEAESAVVMAQQSNELRSAASKTEAPRLAFSEEEAKALRIERQAVLSRVYAQKKSWVASRASSGSGLSAKTQARYRLKLIEGYVEGNEAMKKGNWAEAIRGFMAGIRDPDADAVTRYTCFDQMRMAAKMLKDYDLYLEILKEQGLLIENEDLAILGIEKSSMGTKFYETRRRFVQAVKDPVNGFKRSVDEIMKAHGLSSDEDRKTTEERFKIDLADWQADFERTS